MEKKKILLIDDEPELVELLKERLESSGYEFVSASNGEEGLIKVGEEAPDFILLDLIMPKMNGYDVCKRLKENPGTKDIPILIITASGTKDLEQKCLALGANAVIMKPYDSADLLVKIKELLK